MEVVLLCGRYVNYNKVLWVFSTRFVAERRSYDLASEYIKVSIWGVVLFEADVDYESIHRIEDEYSNSGMSVFNVLCQQQ